MISVMTDASWGADCLHVALIDGGSVLGLPLLQPTHHEAISPCSARASISRSALPLE
jgi:hypothetical protein